MERHTRHNQPADPVRRSRSTVRSRNMARVAADRARSSGGIPTILTRIWSWAHLRSENRYGRPVGAAVILLMLSGSCLFLTGAARTPAGHVQRPVRLAEEKSKRMSSNPPTEGHWIDTTDGTAYLVQLQPNADGYATFDFTTPAGQHLSGALPLVTLADGTLAQGSSVIAGVTTTLPPTVPPRCRNGILQSDTPVPVFYTFLAHVSADGLGAFATLSYASPQDQVGVALLCKGVQGTGVTTYQLSAGCTLTSCTDLTSLTGPTVASHDTALLAAEQNGSLSNWTTVYNLTSRQVTAQYSSADFAALFNQQMVAVGKITAISTPLASPVVEFTPEGQAYFAVTQMVTFQHRSASHTRTLTSYYILENGTWLFWFTG